MSVAIDRSSVDNAQNAKPILVESDSEIVRYRIRQVLATSTFIQEGISLPSVRRLQWEYLTAVLQLCNGNLSEAARRIDMPRRTLQRILCSKRGPTR